MKVFIHTAIFLDVASVRRNGEVGMLALMTADGVGSIFSAPANRLECLDISISDSLITSQNFSISNICVTID